MFQYKGRLVIYRHQSIVSQPCLPLPLPLKHCVPILASSNSQLHNRRPPLLISLDPAIYRISASTIRSKETSTDSDNVQPHGLCHPHHQHPPLHPRPRHLHRRRFRLPHPRRREHHKPPLRVRLRRLQPHLPDSGDSSVIRRPRPRPVEGLSIRTVRDAYRLGWRRPRPVKGLSLRTVRDAHRLGWASEEAVFKASVVEARAWC